MKSLCDSIRNVLCMLIRIISILLPLLQDVISWISMQVCYSLIVMMETRNHLLWWDTRRLSDFLMTTLLDLLISDSFPFFTISFWLHILWLNVCTMSQFRSAMAPTDSEFVWYTATPPSESGTVFTLCIHGDSLRMTQQHLTELPRTALMIYSNT